MKTVIEFRNPGNTIVVQQNNIKKLFINKYNAYKQYFDEVYFYTFDKKDIEKLEFPLIKNVLYNRYNLHSIIYAFLTPIIHYNILKKADYFFPLQIPASLYAIYCSIFFKNKKIVLFWNYNWNSNEWLKEKNFFYKIFVKCWCWITVKFIKNYVAITETEKNIILKYNPKAKVEVLPTPINLNYYKNMNLARKKNSLLFVGRLEKQKNLFNLFEAVSKIKDCELHIVGEGSLKEQLMEYKKKLGIKVIFYNKLNSDEVIKMLNIHSIFILPSYYEGISNALVEAMACKIPVITSDIPPNREIIKDKVNGILCSTNAESIKEAIEYALNNPEKIKEYAENAYQMMVEKFSEEKYFQKIYDFIQKI